MPSRPVSNGHSVTVDAPARLHLGFLDLAGDLGRRFVSLGLAIDTLSTRVVAEPADVDAVEGFEPERAMALLSRLRPALAAPPVRVAVERAIPSHVGLGSGTQLALAIAAALAGVVGRTLTPEELARMAQRGARSGIGIGAFLHGGFMVDGGKGHDGAPPPITARLDLPDRWRVLLLLDGSRTGLSGVAERHAFADLPPFPPELAAQLCRLTLVRLLPAVALGDLATAGSALAEIQQANGDHFAPAQGGRFSSPDVADALGWLERRGIIAVGQSSWGPTGFALVEAAQADELLSETTRLFPMLAVESVRGRNRGASVTID